MSHSAVSIRMKQGMGKALVQLFWTYGEVQERKITVRQSLPTEPQLQLYVMGQVPWAASQCPVLYILDNRHPQHSKGA